jgi:hypothetical protein
LPLITPLRSTSHREPERRDDCTEDAREEVAGEGSGVNRGRHVASRDVLRHRDLLSRWIADHPLPADRRRELEDAAAHAPSCLAQ